MAKFYGAIGYAEIVDKGYGISKEKIVERKYNGDVLQDIRRLETGEGVNDDINVSNQISIVADAFAYQHFYAMRYVSWCGTRWKVSSVNVKRPRLILTLGGIYNGEGPEEEPECSVDSEAEVPSCT